MPVGLPPKQNSAMGGGLNMRSAVTVLPESEAAAMFLGTLLEKALLYPK